MHCLVITAVALLSSFVSAQTPNCPNSYGNFTCPYDGYNACPSTSLTSNIIFRCSGGCPQAGNCNDNLAGVPPVGVKSSALCWDETPNDGKAQCVVDCVSVTLANGTTFYPVGCSTASAGNGTTTSSGSTSTSTVVVINSTTTGGGSTSASTTSSASGGASTNVGGGGSGSAGASTSSGGAGASTSSASATITSPAQFSGMANTLEPMGQAASAMIFALFGGLFGGFIPL